MLWADMILSSQMHTDWDTVTVNDRNSSEPVAAYHHRVGADLGDLNRISAVRFENTIDGKW